MGKRSVMALTPWRAATCSIWYRSRGLPVGEPQIERWPAMSGKAWMEMGEGGTPTMTERSLGAQAVDDGLPVLVGADGGEQKVEGAGELLEGAIVSGVDEVVRAQPARLFFLVG